MNIVKIMAHPAAGFMVGLLLFMVGLKELLKEQTGSPTGGVIFMAAGILYALLNYIKYQEINDSKVTKNS